MARRHDNLLDMVADVADEDPFAALRHLQVCGVNRLGHILFDGWIIDGYLARGIIGSKCLAHTENVRTVRVRCGIVRVRHDTAMGCPVYMT